MLSSINPPLCTRMDTSHPEVRTQGMFEYLPLSGVCWAVLTYVIGLSLSVLLFRLVNEPCASVLLQGDSPSKEFYTCLSLPLILDQRLS